MAKKQEKITVYKYRLNGGSHVAENEVLHRKGGTFWSAQELLKHNQPGERRFELLDKREGVNEDDYADLLANGATKPQRKAAAVPDPEPEDDYGEYSLDELVAYAGEEGIDISACNGDRTAIAQLIKQAESGDE